MNLEIDKISLDRVLSNIAHSCVENIKYVSSNGLFNGKMGLALFFFFYYDYSGNNIFFYRGFDLIKDVIEDLKKGRKITAYLANGLCGVAWCMDILFKKNFLESSIEEIFGFDFPNRLLTKSEYAFKIGNQDYLHGAWGLVNYLNEKNIDLMPLLFNVLKNPKNGRHCIKYNSLSLSSSVIDFDISLGHGRVGALAVLGNIYKKSGQNLFLKNIILESSYYLLKRVKDSIRELDIGSSIENSSKYYSWCSGHLSVCMVLINIFEELAEKEKCQEIVFLCEQLAINCVQREPSYSDIYLCHGLMGYIYLFEMLHEKHQRVVFKLASNYWMSKMLDHFTLIDSGKKQAKENFPDSIEFGLINGFAGIGLCLISFLAPPKKYSWDKVLLIS